MAGRAVYPWVALGGSSRRYLNPNTGETISRERYDALYGSLFRRGEKSFKRATAKVPQELRLSRPARGRGSSARSHGSDKISGLKPLAGKQSRNVNIEYSVYYTGDQAQLIEDSEEYRGNFDDAVKRVKGNSRIAAVSMIIVYQNQDNGHSGFYTIRRIEDKNTLGSYDEFINDLSERVYAGDELGPITFHCRFFDWATRKKNTGIKALKIPKGFKKK